MFTSTRMKLSKDQIVETALALLQSEGLAALNMRALARRLGVRASALYRHFESKEVLLGAMSQKLFENAKADIADGLAPAEWLRMFGVELRRNLLLHRDSALLCTTAPPLSGDPLGSAPAIAQPLTDGGISQDDALASIASVIALTVGLTAYQQSEFYADYLDRMLGFDRAFDRGLRALVKDLGEAD